MSTTAAEPMPWRRGFGLATDILAALLTLTGLLWALDVPRLLGLLLYNEQLIAAMLGLGLVIVFLRMAGDRAHAAAALPAVAAGVVSGAVCFYLAVRYPALLLAMVMNPEVPIAIGAVLVLALLFAVRRVTGLFMAGVLVAFVLLALFGDLLPPAVQGRSIGWERLLAYLAIDPTATLGLPLLVTCTIVLAFVFFGTLIVACGGSEFFTNLAVSTVGRYRGGPAKVAVVGSALFGSVSGSAVANVVATGVVTIPLMRQAGYNPRVAGAIEAVSSTGGQLLPPIMGAAAFLMAEFLQISYGEVLLAALLPALLYYLAVFIYTDLVAARDGLRYSPGEGAAPAVGGWRIAAAGWPFLLPFAALVYALFGLGRRPEVAALVAAAVLVGATLLAGRRRLREVPRLLVYSLTRSGHALVEIIVIAAAAGVIIGILNLSGTGFALSLVLLQLGGGNLVPVLAVTAVVSIVLGMGMPTVGVYVLLATLAAPALVELGVPAIAAHLFVLYFGMMSMITPPVAIASYAAAAITGASPMRTALEAVRVGWVAYIIPFLFAISPSLLMLGDFFEIAASVVTAVFGVWFITAAVVGYGLAPLGVARRAFFAVAGFFLLVPLDAFGYAHLTTILALAAAGTLFLAERLRPRTPSAAGRAP